MRIDEVILTFFPELIGAGLGAYLGYRYGIKQERELQKEEYVERKNNLIHSLLSEIEFNNKLTKDKIISYKMFGEGSLAKVKLIYANKLMTDNYESSIYSGTYFSLSSGTKRLVSTYYYNCKRINELTQKYDYQVLKLFKTEDERITLYSEYGELDFNPEIFEDKVNYFHNLIKDVEQVTKALKSELE